MSVLGAPIFNLMRYAARTRDHFHQAVETIKLCRELQCTADYSNQEQVSHLILLFWFKDAIQTSSNHSAPFDEFRATVMDNYPEKGEFNRTWEKAEMRDGLKKRILKAAQRRVEQGSSSEWLISISFVNPDETVFNYDDVPTKSITRVIVKCRKNDTIDGLLWLFTHNRSSDSSANLKLLYCPHFYESGVLTGFNGTTDDVKPISHPPQSQCRLRLLWDRDPPFYFTVVFRDSSRLQSYGNIWRLNNSNDSPFVLKERSSGRLILSTKIVKQFPPNNEFNVCSPAEGHAVVERFNGRAPQDFATGFFEKVLLNQTKATPNWKLEPVPPPPFPSPLPYAPRATRRDSEQSYYSAEEHFVTPDGIEITTPSAFTLSEPSHPGQSRGSSSTFTDNSVPSLPMNARTSQNNTHEQSLPKSRRSGISVDREVSTIPARDRHSDEQSNRPDSGQNMNSVGDNRPRPNVEHKGQSHSTGEDSHPSTPSTAPPLTNGTSLVPNDKNPAPKKQGFLTKVKRFLGF